MTRLTTLAGTLGMLLATSAFAQTDPATDQDQDATSPMTQEAPASDPAAMPDASATGAGMEDAETVAEDPMAPSDPAPVDVTTVSAEGLMGADIMSGDGETIATVEDVVLTDDGQIESFVAQFGGVLGFGSNRVELTPDELQFMQEEGGSIFAETSLTPEDLEGRPEYEEPNSDSAG